MEKAGMTMEIVFGRILFVLLFFSTSVAGSVSWTLKRGKSLYFSRQDNIQLPTYNWPRTLLSYPITFEEKIKDPSELELFDELGRQTVDFQLSDICRRGGYITSATINFFAELPTGGCFKYSLGKAIASSWKDNTASRVEIKKGEDFWQVTDGHIGVSIPCTLLEDGGVPAPLYSMTCGGRTIGQNRLFTGQLKVKAIQTSLLESGNLFAECKVDYSFDNGGCYSVKIKLVSGYPFVILSESIEGLEKNDDVRMEMHWTHFTPSLRFGSQWDRVYAKAQAWKGIDTPFYTNYMQEDPHWTGMGWIEKPEEEMIYRLLPYGGNSVREQTPVISFWEQQTGGLELGVFVHDHNQWNDGAYGIWQPTNALSVKFRYKEKCLDFSYPIVAGTRSTSIALYPVSQGEEATARYDESFNRLQKMIGASSKVIPYRYAHLLHVYYSLLSLDKVKDWVLDYPAEARRPENPFGTKHPMASDDFYKEVLGSAFAKYTTGLNSSPGVHSIAHRPVFSSLVEAYLCCYKEMTEKQRKSVEALFLLGGYVNTLEAMNAVRTCLCGTPNMSADGWSVPMQMAFLFPEHEMASEWADFFEKMIELNGLFYTRPDVRAYSSKGGRWTESLGVYNWAYLRPTSHSNIASELFDGKNRFADQYMAARGRWLVDMLTAPVNGSRGYPPHGAHGGGRLVKRFASLYQLGNWMENYDPILAEHIFWTGEQGEEVEAGRQRTDWLKAHAINNQNTNRGTNPHLRSAKYTGHGIVLRAGVDTPNELSIHLNQIDKGPNYRWGHQGQGNAGGLYFYAGGKIYTGHENEAAGDHTQNNLDGVTNFEVIKNGEYRTIGMNELTAPLYDFSSVQFAELRSSCGKDKYVWPEYLSRSVMLVGDDYFLLFDETGTNWRAFNRFSWFIPKDAEFPQIVFLSAKARTDHWTEVQTMKSRGFYRDSEGSLLTLVTHKKEEVDVVSHRLLKNPLLAEQPIYESQPSGQEHHQGVFRINTSHSQDIVFRDRYVNYDGEQEAFVGKAGVIRRENDGRTILALFEGKHIASMQYGISVLDTIENAGLHMSFAQEGLFMGETLSEKDMKLAVFGIKPGGRLYIDGEEHPFIIKENKIEFVSPAGKHFWEYCEEDPHPMPVEIVDTEYAKQGIRLYLSKQSSCKDVMIQLSSDGGNEWTTIGETKKNSYWIKHLPFGKYHVRAVSKNGEVEALFAQEYPIYVSSNPPHYPEGLKLKINNDCVNLNWGQILGAEKYRLYRRKAGETKFRLVYEGKSRLYTDAEVSGGMTCLLPGRLDNMDGKGRDKDIYEYAVTSVNGRGESTMSPLASTDPTLWTNWYPQTQLKFKRRTAFWDSPYVYPEMIPDLYYPD